MPKKRRPRAMDVKPEGGPHPGVAGPGESINPMGLPDEAECAEGSPERPRPAPAPGVPVSAKAYERLKLKAKQGAAPRLKHAQEDRPNQSSESSSGDGTR